MGVSLAAHGVQDQAQRVDDGLFPLLVLPLLHFQAEGLQDPAVEVAVRVRQLTDQTGLLPVLAGLGLLQGLHALKDAGNGLVPLTVLLLGLLVHAPHHHILPAEHIAQPAQDVAGLGRASDIRLVSGEDLSIPAAAYERAAGVKVSEGNHAVVAHQTLFILGNRAHVRQIIQKAAVLLLAHAVGVILVGQRGNLRIGEGGPLRAPGVEKVLLGLSAAPALLVGLNQLLDKLLPGEGFQLLLQGAAGQIGVAGVNAVQVVCQCCQVLRS